MEASNAKEMRAALEKCLELGERIDSWLAESEETVWALRAERSMAYNIAEFARAALAAPPRNCDMPWCTSYEAAVAMHLVKVGPNDKGGERGLVEWLLATATQETCGDAKTQDCTNCGTNRDWCERENAKKNGVCGNWTTNEGGQ